MKKIAIIGSSGGNLYNQGGSDPYGMMKEIFVQADSAGIEVAYIQFIGTSRSMDNISEDAKARLFTLSGEREVVESEEKKLSQINELALKHDAKLKEMIEADEIDGIMLMSCDPKGVNREALKAASVKKFPLLELAERPWLKYRQWAVMSLQHLEQQERQIGQGPYLPLLPFLRSGI